jgi:tetratricopeptide (TPR) repeat protein
MLLPLLIAAASVQQLAPLQSPTITVTGPRIQDYRERLAACLARRCPTDEDADATLALAEALLLQGEYREGRDILQASLRRNRRNAGAFPEPVSDLYRAHARLSHHLGFADDARRSTFGILGALREGLPQEDHRHFTARFELGEYLIQSGNIVSARRELARLREAAQAAGRDDVVALAELRGLWFDYVAARSGEEGGRDLDAKRTLARLAQLTEPAQRMRAIGARILLSRIHRIEGRTAEADTLLADIGRSSARGNARHLLFSPPYELVEHQMEPMAGAMSYRELITSGFSNGYGQIPDNFEDKWIDVGFWVMPDGRVSGLEILRQGSNPDWADPLIASMRDRRYTPAAEPSYRLERYTYTSDYEQVLRTRIPQRSRRARVEFIDLTTGEAPPVPPPAAASPSG